jgi:hypothetical protein
MEKTMSKIFKGICGLLLAAGLFYSLSNADAARDWFTSAQASAAMSISSQVPLVHVPHIHQIMDMLGN